MKKIISIIIAIAIAMGSALSAYASEKYYVAYDDNGNRYVLREDQILGITYDAEGNIVDTEISTRMAYLQGTQKTIPAGGKFTSYQYQPKSAFGIGFYFAYYNDENVTTRNRTVRLTIKSATSVGASTRYVEGSETFSTNEEDNYNNPYYKPNGGGYHIEFEVDVVSSRPYYNGVYENLSSSPATVSLLLYTNP